MRKLCVLLVLFSLAIPSFAGSSAVTATITDSDSQTWNNGPFQVTFVPLPGTRASDYNVNGASFTQSFSGTMNGSGVLTVTLTDLSTIAPTGGQWRFNLCPNASSPCSAVVTSAVVGATPNLSAQLSANLAGPRFLAGVNSYGYSDTEATSIAPGGIYFNVTTMALRTWNGSAWQGASTGSTTTCGTPTCTISIAGGGNGVLALSGNTSGTATFTAPATAGTATNPVVMSNVLQGPSGLNSAVTYGVAGGNTNGMYSAAANDVSIAANSTRTLAVQPNAVFLGGAVNSLSTLHTLWFMATTPTIAAAGCGGAAASIPSSNGTAVFTVNVGTTNTGTCTITMNSTAANGWACNATDITTNSTAVFVTKQSGNSNIQVVLKNFSDVAANVAWTDSDVLDVQCTAF